MRNNAFNLFHKDDLALMLVLLGIITNVTSIIVTVLFK